MRTSLKSTFLKVKGLGYLWDKEAEWPEIWGKIIGGKRKVKQLAFHTGLSKLHASSWDACSENGSTSMIREGNGDPLQYSCLENPTDGGAQ